MKRLFLILSLCALTVSASFAQTEFRKITLKEALAASKAEGKPVFIDFHTSWCGPCKMMAKKIFPLENVGRYMNEAFINIQLDAEKEAPEDAKHYKVEAYPTMIVVDSDGKEIYRVVGANLDSEAFITDLKSGTNPNLSTDKVEARYEAGERNAETVSAYAAHLIKQSQSDRRNPDPSKVEKAQKIVKDYFATLNDEQRLSADNFFIYSWNYTQKPDDQTAQWLLNNKSRFSDKQKNAVDETIQKLVTYRAGIMLQGIEQFNSSDIDALVDYNTKSGLKDGVSDAAIRILRAELQGDEAYLNQLKKDWDKLPVEECSSIATTYANHFKSEDKATLDKANNFLRSKLANMDASNIYYAAANIMQLERKINPQTGH